MNDDFELYDLEVSVEGDQDSFVCSHIAGHAFKVEGENLIFGDNNKFSLYALAALLPLLPAKQRESHQNDWMTSDECIACPDPNCGARFKIVRVRKRIFKHSDVTKVPVVNQKVGESRE
ncbi:MAG TPA: TIGR04076 family protein [Patescibacteria group bacterium]|jgi:uncharacterized repeat protein (TIGR04076 family)|nr:TIGR04076 family protein [Patescibacteria group bacterium]